MHLSACSFRIFSPGLNPLIPASSPLRSPLQPLDASQSQLFIGLTSLQSHPPLENRTGWEPQRCDTQGVPPVVDFTILRYFERLEAGCKWIKADRDVGLYESVCGRQRSQGVYDYKSELLELELFLTKVTMKLIWKVKREIGVKTLNLIYKPFCRVVCQCFFIGHNKQRFQ